MMKLNCDMGESYGPWKMGVDAEVMPYVDMSNIACGFHASDPQIMSKTVSLAVKHHVSIGAHPGYPDLLGFGRKEIKFSVDELINIVLYQVGALQAICGSHGASVDYVKPHGALYNVMMKDVDTYTALVKAVSLLKAKIPLMIMATPNHKMYLEIAEKFDVPLLFEAFCDRAYMDDGSLQPRQEKGSVFHDVGLIEAQAKSLIEDKKVKTVTGKTLDLVADTICIHGDGSLALTSAQKIRDMLN
jgi:5-oxoprolinase (ATP-hydrolysing) subunit A